MFTNVKNGVLFKDISHVLDSRDQKQIKRILKDNIVIKILNEQKVIMKFRCRKVYKSDI